jgi:hypothetical protein
MRKMHVQLGHTLHSRGMVRCDAALEWHTLKMPCALAVQLHARVGVCDCACVWAMHLMALISLLLSSNASATWKLCRTSGVS